MKLELKIWLLLGLITCPFYLFAQINKTSTTNIESILYGTLIDSTTKEPLAGATVQIIGTTHSVVTSDAGKFEFITGQKLPFRIKITAIGYKTTQLEVYKNTITVALPETQSSLNDVVISSGYSSQNKKKYTGSVAHITGSALQNIPAQSFDQLLGGQAAGVSIVAPSNTLNNTPALRIRGINSINSGIYPLVVVDGVTVFTGSVGGNVGNNPLADINPSDIESIDVLKDASATAIYGSRAANGVLVITTKKGKKGKTRVSYDGWASISKAANLPKILEAKQYVEIKNEAMVNAGKTPGFALLYNTDSSIVNTNWYDVAYHSGLSQNHNINFSGSNDATNYYVSLNYTNQNGFIRTNNFTRKGARLNIDHHLFSGFVIGANINYSNSINSGPNTGAIPTSSTSLPTSNTQYIGTEPLARLTYILPPNVRVYNPDGTYSIQNGTSVGYGANNSNPTSTGYVGVINAYNLQEILDLDKNTSTSNSILGNVYAEWEVAKGLKVKTTYGMNDLDVINKSFLNPFNGDGASSNGAATNTTSKYHRTNWTNTVVYNTVFAQKHNLTVLGGYEKINRTIDSWGAQETGLTDPFYTNYQGGWKYVTATGNTLSQNVLLSYFSNINYDYDKKYLVSVNFRRDGLSALAAGNKWGNFGGASVGWNVSEERFFKNATLSNTISQLKVRASYGVVGNSEIGDYPALGTYSSTTYGGFSALYFSQAGNPNLKWEKSNKTDIGLNLSLFRNRINLDFDYYNNSVSGLILKTPQTASTGIPNNYIYANVGSLYNRGFEFNIDAHIINSQNWRWNAGFNISTLKNKITSLISDVYTNIGFGIQNMTRVGYSIGSIFAVPTVGVDPSNGYRIFVNAAGKEVEYNQIGAPKWTYRDGSAATAIDNYTDGQILGPSLPTYSGGFNNTVGYKNFELTANVTYAGGNKLYNGTTATLSDQRYFNNGTFILDRWTHAGQITDVPKLVYGDNVSSGFLITNSARVENGSYLKLKTLSLAYRIPLSGLITNNVSSIRVYAQATNLFTITKYTGSDPEVSINGNSINSGKDQNVPPNARVFTFGVNVGF
ncbi:SusC/RagA family TonB-linked outer membrane protein [Polluticoccus soli]